MRIILFFNSSFDLNLQAELDPDTTAVTVRPIFSLRTINFGSAFVTGKLCKIPFSHILSMMRKMNLYGINERTVNYKHLPSLSHKFHLKPILV